MRFSIRDYWSGAALMALPALAHAAAKLPAVCRVPLDFISLACALPGFATRCAHDENSRVPAALPTFLRDAGKGGLMAIRKLSRRHATEKSRGSAIAALSATQPSTDNTFVSI